MIWLHGPTRKTCCGSHAVKPRGLYACQDGKVVHRSRIQSSCHNTQGFVDGRIVKAGVGTVTPYTVLTSWVDKVLPCAMFLHWLPSLNRLVTSSMPHRILPSCAVIQGVSETWVTCSMSCWDKLAQCNLAGAFCWCVLGGHVWPSFNFWRYAASVCMSCSGSSPITASLQRRTPVRGHLHRHTSLRQYQAGHGCKC